MPRHADPLGGLNLVVSRGRNQGESFRKGRRWRPSRILPHPTILGVLLVELTRGCAALIDEADRALVEGHSWYLDKQGYAAGRPIGRAVTTLHLHLWRSSGGSRDVQVDHVNVDRLDCRRANLRAATPSQNLCNRKRGASNTSGAKGVSRHGARWRAAIGVAGKMLHIGVFPTVEQAAEAYAIAATMFHGDYARLA